VHVAQVINQLRLTITRNPCVVHQEIRPLDLPTPVSPEHWARISTEGSSALLYLETFPSQSLDLDVSCIDVVMDHQDPRHCSAPLCHPPGSPSRDPPTAVSE
jgi:hypothetical protein